MKSDTPRHWARRPHGYNGAQLDRGQIMALAGCINDEKLVGYGYLAVVDPKAETFRCSTCGAEFVSFATRQKHGDDRHRPTPFDPREEDRRLDREEKLLEQIAPLAVGAAT